MKRKLEKTIVRVIYWDSTTYEHQTDEIILPSKIEAVGFLIHLSKDHITLAREVINPDAINDMPTYTGQLSIPKKCIITFVELESLGDKK